MWKRKKKKWKIVTNIDIINVWRINEIDIINVNEVKGRKREINAKFTNFI